MPIVWDANICGHMEYWEHQEHDNLKFCMQRIFLVLKIENCNYNENVNSMWKITSDSKKKWFMSL